MLDFLKQLRTLTSTPHGCTRLAYSELENAAHDLAWEYVSDLPGLTRVADAAGNTFIVPQQSLSTGGAPVTLIGSHLDTVIEGGWLDGALGVAAGLEAVRKAASRGVAHPNLGVLIFRDEEGVRFNNGLFGSRVFAGLCCDEDLAQLDDNGRSLKSILPDPDHCLRYRPPVQVAAFLECHIEQGMRLEASGARIGVVTGIVGIRRFVVRSSGAANHAGTTEMARRRDALIPMCRIVAALPSLVCGEQDAVITCGRMTVSPGAPNVVPGSVEAAIEFRAPTGELLDEIEARLRALVLEEQAHARAAGVTIGAVPGASIEPASTDTDLSSALRDILEQRGVPFVQLPSMAGHDTQHAATVCPAAMFFIPSIGGMSHNPDEDSRAEDILLAGDVMHEWALQCLLRQRR